MKVSEGDTVKVKTLIGIIDDKATRPAGASAADQKRTMTPAVAIAAGADYLVVGRPVAQAKNPREAAEAIIAEIAAVQS